MDNLELVLKRTYYPNGTNGELWCGDRKVVCTIELPWLENQQNVSCIPEGRYQLIKRFTKERGWHIYLPDVSERSWILFHPANNALEELEGCIAPVMKLTGPGTGALSSKAVRKIEQLVFESLANDQKVFVNIKKKENMNLVQRAKAPTPKFFKVLRTVGLALAAAGGAILAAPVALPAGIVTLGGYLTVGGSIITAVSQVTVEDEALKKIPADNG